MGHLIKQKAKSRRGISMVMALVFLLVSSALGAVILAASSANAGHIQSSWANQKEYFAVASAVKLLKEDFANMKFTGSYKAEKTVTTLEGKDGAGNPVQVEKTSYAFSLPEGKFPLTGSTILNETFAADFLDFGPAYRVHCTSCDWPDAFSEFDTVMFTQIKDEKDVYLRIQSQETEVNLTPVEVKISPVMKDASKKFTLNVQVYIPKEDKSGNPYKSYVTNMVFTPKIVAETPEAETVEKVSGKTTEVTTTVNHKTNVTWECAEVTRG